MMYKTGDEEVHQKKTPEKCNKEVVPSTRRRVSCDSKGDLQSPILFITPIMVKFSSDVYLYLRPSGLRDLWWLYCLMVYSPRICGPYTPCYFSTRLFT